jgi:hypothetical protein
VAIGVPKPTRFFIPNSSKAETEAAYLEMKKALVDQLKMTVLERRIFKLSRTTGKRTWQFEVGGPKPQESQYIVMAIFESSVFIVMHQTPDGDPGPIVLIDKAEVLDTEEFRA